MQQANSLFGRQPEEEMGGRAQIRFHKGGQSKFFIITRAEITYILMKNGSGEIKVIHEGRKSVCIEQT